MSDIVISIENLNKQYRLGIISHRTLYRDIQSLASRILNREDPNSIIGVDKSRTRKGIFHALDDISLDIKQGDVLGIIGKNGAGKSTLLKILSRVTSPTSGSVKIKGKIASLLEVGTGFHPELTGRENIYLNGAILGMRKHEITKKFDEIVVFSGIEEFIDTPVKRYSSGMYVRLAFSVAAHLDSEILIVDEVLAVGDAEFRKKCLGKMNEVSHSGKTILFVSHEISAIANLCSRGILLNSGKVTANGSISKILPEYFSNTSKATLDNDENNKVGDDLVEFVSARLIDVNEEEVKVVKVGQKFGVEIVIRLLKDSVRVNPCFTIFSAGQVVLTGVPPSAQIKSTKGIHKYVAWFPNDLLNNDTFSIRISAVSFYPTVMHFDLIDFLFFEVIETESYKREIDYQDRLYGFVRPAISWVSAS